MTFEAFGGFCAVVIFAANNERVSLELIIWEDLINPKLEFSNHSAGIFSFVDARGKDKRSSMHGSQLRAGPRAFSRSGKRRTSSSSWAGKSPNFRREIRQSHYRNDPVKYDLNLTLSCLFT